jgi:hypothetical protein
MDIKGYIEGITKKPLEKGTLIIDDECGLSGGKCIFGDIGYYAMFIDKLGIKHFSKGADTFYFSKKLMDNGVQREWYFVIAKEPFEERFTLTKINNTMDRFNGKYKIKS